LIENRDRAVGKEEILNTVWNATYVTENALTREIGKLRKLLGDDPKAPKYIQTVHTLGYRFIAELDDASSEETPVKAQAPQGERANSRENTAPKRAHSHRALKAALTIAIALGLISAIVGWKRRSKIDSPGHATAANSVAILPFKTSVPGEEYLGLEIADTLVTRLSNGTKLSVSPIAAALHYESRLRPVRRD
jgi:DNA-binding winged helix-turn-helix (wHTH) protein